MQEVRLIFSKTDSCKYIGHLDVNRCMLRAMTRAKIPLWYTEGFNPHPYIEFSLPLPLGVESNVESMNIRLIEDMPYEDIKTKLNETLPVGLRIIDVYDDFRPVKDIAYSNYVFKIQFRDNENALKSISNLLSGDEIIVQKKAKKGKRRILKDVDVKHLIHSYDISLIDDDVVTNACLAAGIERNLSPTLLLDKMIDSAGQEYEWKNVLRVSLLDKDFNVFK